MTDIKYTLETEGKNSFNDTLTKKMCKCGHLLYQHANDYHYDSFLGIHYFRVLQCVLCDCEEFGQDSMKEKYSVRNNPQPDPVEDKAQPHLVTMVMNDLEERKKVGEELYGMVLRPHNGRDPLIDLYQEILDSALYCRQLIFEKYGE